MASFTFNTMVLDQGTTFVFGSWFYVANGSGGFNSHLTNPREPEAISVKSSNIANRSSDLGEMLLPDLAKEIEEKLAIIASSTRSQIKLRLEPTRPKIHCVQPIFWLHSASSVYRKLIKSIYFAQEKGLDHPVYVEHINATASREAPVFDVYSDSDDSSLDDNLNLIINALAQFQAKS